MVRLVAGLFAMFFITLVQADESSELPISTERVVYRNLSIDGLYEDPIKAQVKPVAPILNATSSPKIVPTQAKSAVLPVQTVIPAPKLASASAPLKVAAVTQPTPPTAAKVPPVALKVEPPKVIPAAKPIVASPALPPKPALPPQKVWTMRAGESLESGLRRWAQSENLQLRWNVDRHFPVTADIQILGSFDDAITKLMHAYESADKPVKFDYGIYSNRIFSVKMKGESDQ